MDEQMLRKLIGGNEDEHYEFKVATNSFSKEELLDYCCALYNEGGGKLILGITDKKPRFIVGSLAFQNIEETKHYVLQMLRIRIEILELLIDQKRVLIITIPALSPGSPISYKGRYRMRSGESLVDMSVDQIRSLLENVPDPSSQFIQSASLNDLDPEAVKKLRLSWYPKNDFQDKLSDNEFLNNCELAQDGKVTYAAIIILGKETSIRKLLPQSEAIFEYRNNANSITSDKRLESNLPIIFLLDYLWSLIDSLNSTKSTQMGLFRNDIKSFNESVIREALLNAFVHRDYYNGNSVFIKMSPETIQITSPGGLPKGVTIENIIDRQNSRNRLIADIMQRINWVERSGQGFDKMWQNQTLESKSGPDLTGTDEYQVQLTIDGTIHDPKLFDYLKKINALNLNIHELVVINYISFGKKIPNHLERYRESLLQKGYIEKNGTSRGMKYLLAKDYYDFSNQKGVYIRKKGLSDASSKQIILETITSFKQARIVDMEQALPGIKRTKIHLLLNQLRENGKIKFEGSKKTGMWKICG